MAAAVALLATIGCADEVGHTIARLEVASTASERELLAAKLVVAARGAQASQRQRIIDGLSLAYRRDVGREHLVSALAALRAQGSAPVLAVYVSALGDFARGRVYLRSARTAARALGELGSSGRAGERARAALIASLSRVRSHAVPRWVTSRPP
ncbi:MAG: hypothetical protein KC503_08845, partial [Myxococcales bacterium]|nr:hypothetical protein [Myxococcales bacterium]